MTKPIISVIIPTLNSEKFIKETIDSILRQTYKKYEIIIIDDASTDKTIKKLKSYKNEKIRIIENKKRIGLAASRNLGIKKALGKYIAFLDSDDIAIPNRFKSQSIFLNRHKNFGACGSQCIYLINGKNKEVSTHHPLKEDYFKANLLFMAGCLPSTLMIRKSVLIKNDIFFSKFKTLEDYEFETRLIEKTRIKNISPPLVKYRVHTSNLSNKKEIIKQEKIDRTNIIKTQLNKINFQCSNREIHDFMLGNYQKFKQHTGKNKIHHNFIFFKRLFRTALNSKQYSKKSLEYILEHKFKNNFNYFKDNDTSHIRYNLLESFIQNMKKENVKNKIKIYFLFHSKAFWPSWETLWNACNEDPRITTKMIFCPVTQQYKGWGGQFINAENWLNKQKISYTNIENINFTKNKPDILIIQTPYEGHREEKYHSELFKKLGIKVIYISYGLEFTAAKENIVNHFQLPIHTNTWRIYTASPYILYDYKKYCPIGNNHVRYLGHPKFDYIYDKDHFTLPKKIIEKAKCRKIVVWKVHFPMKIVNKNGQEYNSTFSWENDKKILDYIKKQKDLFFVFLPHHLFFGVWQYDYNISINELNKFKKEIENNENSTIWYDDYRPIISHCDALMGERSSVTFEMIAYNKPVLYLEEKPEIYNDFGKIILKSYDIARTFTDITVFINKFKKGIDDKREARLPAFNKVFPHLGDNSGYRIKEDIISELENETKINELNSKIQIQGKTIHSLNMKNKKNKAAFDTIKEKYNQLHHSIFYIPYKIWSKVKATLNNEY